MKIKRSIFNSLKSGLSQSSKALRKIYKEVKNGTKAKKSRYIKPSKQLKDGNKALSERSGQTSEAKLTFDNFDKLNLKSFGADVLRVIEGDKILSEA